MTTKQRLAVLGGDARQIAMVHALSTFGYEVFCWGLGECNEAVGSAMVGKCWDEVVAQSDAIVLPLPFSSDGVRLNCPLEADAPWPRITAILDAARGKQVYGGRLSEEMIAYARERGIVTTDYFQSESLQLRNALPTAEGAIAIAMKELPVTIDGLCCAVIGYGRIGRLLSQKLKALGATVTVYARRSEIRAEAEVNGHSARPLSEENGYSDLRKLPPNCRAIFNTVPVWTLTRDILEEISKNCVLIDLASAPGGIDVGAAQELGLRSVWGTALPGKCAPESAGIILAQTLHELLEIHSV